MVYQTIESMGIEEGSKITIKNFPGMRRTYEATGIVTSILSSDLGESIAVRELVDSRQTGGLKRESIKLISGKNLANMVDGAIELVGDEIRSYELLAGPFYQQLDKKLKELSL